MKPIAAFLILVIAACSGDKTESHLPPENQVRQLVSEVSVEDVGSAIFHHPKRFEGEVISLCGRRPIDGQDVIVGNTGRSPNIIYLDRPIKAPSGCITAKLVRGATPRQDPRMADGPIALSGWRLSVVEIRH